MTRLVPLDDTWGEHSYPCGRHDHKAISVEGVITTVGMETLGWYRYEGTVDTEVRSRARVAGYRRILFVLMKLFDYSILD